MIKDLDNLTASEKFVVFALAAEKILKDQAVVFHYFGPSHLKKLAHKLKNEKIEAIIDSLKDLEQEPFVLRNNEFLASQVRSLRHFLEFAGLSPTGETLLQAVRDIVGIEPPKPYDASVLQGKMSAVLSKYGYNNYDEFLAVLNKANTPVSDAELEEIIARIKAFSRSDVAPRLAHGDKLIKRLDASKVSFGYPKEGYPGCYYIYEGNYNASISLSGVHRKNKLMAIQSLMHELYPGHHLYYLYREMLFEEGLLGEEATIDLLYSSETSLNEGIAENGFKLITSFKDEEKAFVEISSAREHFGKKIAYNVWYKMNIEGTMSKSEAEEYFRTVGQISENRFAQLFQLIDKWRIYYPAYPVGQDIIERYLEKHREKAIFKLYLPRPIENLRKETL